MKISEVKNLPKIAAPGGRVVAEVSPEFLKEKGVSVVTYGIAPNEVVEFPDTEADIQLFTRTVRPNSDAVETLLVVKRNGQDSYFSVAALRRMDYQGNFVGPVCKDLQKAENDYDRVVKTCGKKLTCKEMTKIKVRKFNNGVATDELTEREVPVLEYA